MILRQFDSPEISARARFVRLIGRVRAVSPSGLKDGGEQETNQMPPSMDCQFD
jgi:hypothetical protein